MAPIDMQAALLQRLTAFAADDDRAAAEARAVLPRVVEVLVRDFGATRVVLFGSLLIGTFRPDSDIDLVVEGIPAEVFMEAMGRASEVAGRKVDLVDLDWAAASLREEVSARGEVLHVA